MPKEIKDIAVAEIMLVDADLIPASRAADDVTVKSTKAQVGIPIIKYLKTTQTLTNQTSPQAVPDIEHTVDPYGVYLVEGLFLIGNTSTVAGVEVEVDCPSLVASTTNDYEVASFNLTTGYDAVYFERAIFSDNNNIVRSTGYQFTGDAPYQFKVIAEINASGGTFKWKWNQDTSDANVTTLYKGSWARFTKIDDLTP